MNLYQDIIAEMISDNPEYRKQLKRICYRDGVIATKGTNTEEKTAYNMYYEFSEPVKYIKPHRVLAINRGENEKILSVSIDVNTEDILSYIESKNIKKESS